MSNKLLAAATSYTTTANIGLSIHQLHSSDILMTTLYQERLDSNITRLLNYCEITIHQYSIDDFKIY
jgi:hypothetical protein